MYRAFYSLAHWPFIKEIKAADMRPRSKNTRQGLRTCGTTGARAGA
ncbi:MAG: hypothetical protein AB1497_03285 [Bacillota bacterium]